VVQLLGRIGGHVTLLVDGGGDAAADEGRLAGGKKEGGGARWDLVERVSAMYMYLFM